MGRSNPAAESDDASVTLERPRHDSEKRTSSACAVDEPTRGRPSRVPTSPGGAGALFSGRQSLDATRNPRARAESCASSKFATRRYARATTYLLFAYVDAGRAGTSDSGTRGSSGARDNSAIHAPQPGRDRGRDSVTRSAWYLTRFETSWRRGCLLRKPIKTKADFGCGGGI